MEIIIIKRLTDSEIQNILDNKCFEIYEYFHLHLGNKDRRLRFFENIFELETNGWRTEDFSNKIFVTKFNKISFGSDGLPFTRSMVEEIKI